MLIQIASSKGIFSLGSIKSEVDEIENIFKFNKKNFPVVSLLNEPPYKILSALERHEKRLIFLHYGGHASEEMLTFNDKKVYIEGFSKFLKDKKKLHFVFLNGCKTYEQAAFLLENNVKIVLATSSAIEDLQAKEFAVKFYETIANGKSLERAYESAVALLQMKYEKYSKEPIEYKRKGLKLKREEKLNSWVFVYDESYYDIHKKWQPFRKQQNNNKELPYEVNHLINRGYELMHISQRERTNRYKKTIRQKIELWEKKVVKQLNELRCFDELYEFEYLNMTYLHSFQLKKKISLLEHLNIK